MSRKNRKNKALPSRPQFEELEPRILYSADLAPQADAPAETVVAETQVIDESDSEQAIEYAVLTEEELVLAQSPESTDSQILVLDENGESITSPGDSTSEVTEQTLELVFINSDVSDVESLLADLEFNDKGLYQVFQLDEASDGWTQFLDTLGDFENVDAIHFLTHGDDASIKLGNLWINPDNLHEFEDEFRVLGLSLTDDADLLFYGCDTAQSSQGINLLESISDWTGADVAASDDVTGASNQGGDWDLELRLGDIETPLALSESVQATWAGTLAVTTFQQGDVNGYSGTFDTTVDEVRPTSDLGSQQINEVDLDDGASDDAQSLIRFDSIFGTGTGQIPTGSTINSASLTVYVDNPSSGGASVSLHQMLTGWSDASTWNSLTSGVSLNDIEASSSADATVADPTFVGSVTLTGLGSTIQDWLDGTSTNNGWVIVSDSTNGWDFRSSEDTTASQRPVLTVDYTAPVINPDEASLTTENGGLSLNEDGGNDAYVIADDGGSLLGGLSEFTLEMQFSSTQLESGSAFFSYASAGQNNELLGMLGASGQLTVYLAGGSQTLSGFDFRTLNDGFEHSVALTWSNTSGDWEVFVDGQSKGGGTGLGTAQTLDAGGALVFAQEQDSVDGGYQSTQYLQATLHDIRVFDDVRTDAEILSNYNSTLPYDESGMIANWVFNNLSSDNIVTETVSGNNLTVQHATGTGFVASNPSLTYSVNENSLTGTVVGGLYGTDPEREAQITALLAADSDLIYNAETEKFYKPVTTASTWTVASSTALATTLNGVTGQLATIQSANENALLTQIAIDTGQQYWLGATDVAEEGVWRWHENGSEAEQFWQGDGSGYNIDNAFTSWQSGRPDNFAAIQHYLAIRTVGDWNDVIEAEAATGHIVEWDADEVLDATQALAYSITSQTVAGAFTIDADGGQITVANGSLLNYETNATHSITVRTTDVDTNTYDEIFTISLTDLVEVSSAPTYLSSGVELNTDGGNDAFLTDASSGLTYLNGNTGFTTEIQFSGLETPVTSATLYSNRDPGTSYSWLMIKADGSLDWTGFSSTTTFTELFDGGLHSVAVTWNPPTGSVSFFVDGEFAETVAGPVLGSTIGGGTLVVGQHLDYATGTYDTDEHFSGTFHDIRFWDNVRSTEEIALNHQHKLDLTPAEATAMGLVANWQMDGFNGSNEVVDIVSSNNLSIGHAAGVGFTTSTPVTSLNVDENAPNGTTVSVVIPSDPETVNDIVSDGLFTEAGSAAANPTYYEDGSGPGNILGGWSVTKESVDYIGTIDPPPLGGNAVDLAGDFPGAISQTLTSEVGREYQIVFAMAGNFGGVEALKEMRVSAAGQSEDFSISERAGWDWTNDAQWQQGSFTFTADSTSTTLSFEALNTDAWSVMVGNIQVLEIPAVVSTILNNDSSLSYDAATGKFYQLVNTPANFSTALSAATGAQLNGISGQLVTIDDAYENALIHDFVTTSGNQIWLGASDATAEGEWFWLDGSTNSSLQFWSGGAAGSEITGEFTSNVSLSDGAGEHYIRMIDNGSWADHTTTNTHAYVIEWDASEILGNYSFSLTNDASGRFAIDSNTGEVTLADTSLIDYESATSHNITVEVTDAGSNTYSEVMAIAINNQGGEPAQTLPGAQTVDEDNTITFSGGNSNAITVSDTSGTDALLQVTLNTTNGILSLSQTTGLTLAGGSYDSAHMVVNGTESDINAALEGVVFTPTAEFNGAANVQVKTAQAASLEADYSFEAGDAADDAVGTQQNGTLMGDATIVTDGTRGEVLSLDGTGDSVDISSTYGEPTAITIGGWVNLTGAGRADFISLDDRVHIALDDGGAGVKGSIQTGAASWNDLNSGVSISGTGWHHVAYTFDDTNDIHTLYIDGVAVATETITDSIYYTGATTTYLGKHPSSVNYLDGQIDDARIYTRALSADEVAALSTDQLSVVGNVAITVDPVNDAPVFTGTTLVSNGTFDTDISGWTTNSGNLDAVGGEVRFGQVGGANGTLSQTISTTIGETYYVTFDFGDRSATKTQSLEFEATGATPLLHSDIVSGAADITLQPYHYTFVADNTSTTLTFTDTSGDHSGVRGYLDNIYMGQPATPRSALSYTENGSSTIDDQVSLVDIDDGNLESAVIQVTSNYVNGEDSLVFVDQNGISGSWNAGTGILTLSGTATISEYQLALRSITYVNASDNPSTLTRTVSFTVNDGDADSNTQTRNISITAVNDAPAGSDGNIAVTQDTAYTFDKTDFGFSDVESDTFDSVTITTLPAQGTIKLSGIAISAGDSISVANIDSDLLTYEPPAGVNGNGYSSFTFQVKDDGGTANGGVDLDASANTMTIDISVAYSIAGTVYEDVNGDASLADASGISGVTVYLYQDTDDDLVVSAGDTLVTSTTTDGSGNYSFFGLADDTYFVVVDSKSITSSAALNGSFTATDIWAEQTYGVAGALAADGSGGTQTLGSAGAAFGGKLGDVSDDASTLLTAEHVTKVTLGAADASNINSAFSFNVVTGVRDGDDVGAEDRSIQGSFRQFVDNADAISGNNAMRFVPVVATNTTDGSGGNWWSIQLTSALTSVADAGVTIDGTGYSFADGTTVLNTNAATFGTGGSAGVGVDGVAGTGDDPTLAAFQGTELELIGVATASTVITASGDNFTLSDVAIRKLSDGITGSAVLSATGDSNTISNNLIGVSADGTIYNSTGASASLLTVSSSTGGTVSHNYLSVADSNIISAMSISGNSGYVVTQNEIIGSFKFGLSAYSNSSTFSENLVDGVVSGFGIGTFYGPYSNVTIENNTVRNNTGYGAIVAGFGSSDMTVRYNHVHTNSNAIVIRADGSTYDSSQNSVVSMNSIHDNTNNPIATNNVAANDGVLIALDPNQGLDHPIITTANLVTTNLTLEGYVGSAAGQATFASARVEFFISDGGGEGQTYLGFLTTDASGNFSGTLSVSGVTDANKIVATATQTSVGTSEFGNEFDVNVTPTLIALSNNTIAENTNTTGGHSVGTLTTTDADSGDTRTYSINGGADSGVFSIGGAGSDELVIDDGLLDFESQSSYAVTVRVTDSGGLTYDESFTVTVTDVNEAPVNTVPGAQTINEDTSLAIGGISVTDADGNLNTVQLSVSNGVLNVTLQGAASISTGSNASASLTLSGSQTDINSTLATLSYQGNLNFNGSETLTVLSTDTNVATDSDTVAITVNAVNDAPVNTVPASIAVTEDVATALTGISIADVDAGASAMLVTLSVPSGALAASTGGGVTGGGTSSALTLTGSITDINTFIAASNVTYTTAANANGSVTLTVLTSDQGNTGSGGTLTDSDTVALNITAVNDSPLVTTNTGSTVAEASTGNTITTVMLNEGDVDDAGAGLTYTVTTDVVNGTLKLSGVAIGLSDTFTQADIDGGLVTYDHDGSQTSSDSFDFSLADGGEDGATAATGTFNFTVTNVNDAPVNTVPGAQSVNEDTSLAIGGISVADADDNLDSVQLTVSDGVLNVTLQGAASVSAGANGSADLTLSGTLTDINNTLATLSYQGDLNFNGSDTLTVLSTDLDAAADSDTVAITVNAVNDAPVNTVPASIAVTEDVATALTGISIVDVEAAASSMLVTLFVPTGALAASTGGGVTVGGTASALTLTGSVTDINTFIAASNVTYTTAPNANGSVTLTVLTSDQGNTGSGGTLTDSDTVSLNITAVNDAPVNTVPASIAVTEDVATALTGISIADVDAAASSMLVTLSVPTGSLAASSSGGVTVGGTASALTLTGSVTDINTFIAASNVTYTTAADANGSVTLTVLTSDQGNTGSGGTLTDSDTVSLNISAVNDAPVNTVPASIAVTEDVATALTGISIADVDAGASSILVTLSVPTGALAASTGGGVTVSGTASALTLSGTVTDINIFIAASNVTYITAANANGSVTLTVLTSDQGNTGSGGTLTDSDTVALNITAVNDSPLVTTNTGTTVSEGSTGTAITTVMLNEGDVDDAGAGLTYTVTTDVVNGTLKLSGVAIGLSDTFTQADIDGGLITYDHDGSQSSSDSFDFSLADGGENGATAATGTFNFTVTNVNDAPINTVPGAQSVNEDTSLAIGGISVADADDNLDTVQLTVSDGVLNVTLQGAASVSAGTNGSADLTLSGTLTDINNTLATLSYQGDLNFNGSDTLTVLSTDLDAATDSDTVAITVNAVNDDPVNTVPASIAVTEDVATALTGISIADVDAAASSMLVTLSVPSGALAASTGGGVTVGGTSSALTLTGSITDINTFIAASNITYATAANATGSVTLTVLTSDQGNTGSGGTLTDSDTVSLNITAVNDSPTVATNTGVTVAEASTGTAITTVMLNEGDVDDAGAGLTYTVTTDVVNGTLKLSGVAIGLSGTFTQADIDGGLVTYDHDGSQTNSDSIDFSLADGGEDGATAATGTFNFTVTNVNDAPVNTVPGAQTINEDTSLAIGGISVADADDNLDMVKLTVSDGILNVTLQGAASVSAGENGSADLTLSGSLVDINATLATLTYQGDLHFHGSDTLTVLSTDLSAATDSDTVSITVNPVNDAPRIQSLSGTSFSLPNDGTVGLLDLDDNASLSDPDNAADFDGGSLQLTGNSFAAADSLDIDTSGVVALSTGYADGSNVSISGVNIGTLSGVSNSTATVSFNANATAARIDSLLQALSFSSTSTTLGGRSVDLVFNDNDGTANGGAEVSNTATVYINLASANDGLVSTPEDNTYTFVSTDFDFTGITGANLGSITVTSLPATGTLNHNGSAVTLNQQISKADIDAGLLTFVPVANQNGILYASFDFYVNSGKQYVSVLSGKTNDYTLDGLFLADAADILDSSSNFGSSGTYPSTMSVIASSNTIDAAYLSQGQIIIDGFTADGSWSGAELSALDTWVNAGGIAVATSDAINFDPVSEYYGLTVTNGGNATWNVADGTHPIMNGPFGSVGASFNALGSIAYFNTASLAVGDQILATDSVSGEPTMVLRQEGSGYILFISDEGPFRANITGSGTVATANDRFTANLFAWAAELLPPTTSNTVNIDVTAVNDEQSLDTNAGLTLNEGATATITSAMLDTSDIDNTAAQLTYSVTSATTNGQLELTSAAGVSVSSFTQDDIDNNRLVYVHNGSETTSDSFDFSVDDSAGVASTGTFNISVTLQNENAPVVTAAQTFSVSELAANGFSLGNAVATDVDTGTTLSSWTITGGNTGSVFAIDGTTGEITVADNTSLDFDTTASYTLSLTVSDGTNTSAVETVSITVSDVATTITAAQSFSIAESATNASAVGSVVTTGDTPKTFSITGGNTGTAFTIDNNGNITVADASAIDYETLASYTLTIQASDGTTPVSETVTVTITDVNENTVGAISDSNAALDSVAENAVVGTTVGLTALATDPDGTDTVTYSLSDDAGGRFTIDTNTGVVTVNGALNAESSTSHSITVLATSTDTSTSSQGYTITVTDVDEFDVGSVTDSDVAVNTVAENATVGATVGITASASDTDVDDDITYSLSDDAGGLFAIDGSTGIVTVASALDYESATSHNITVLATSDDTSTSSQVFSIAVTDINENTVSAISDSNGAADSVAEDAVVGTAVGITALATDIDGSDTVTYSLSNNAGGRFTIDSNTGVVTVNGALDAESATSHSITVLATSTDTSTSNQSYTITITDLDEFDVGAVSDGNAAVNTVAENATISAAVGITASASDTDVDDDITYSLSDDAGGLFTIDGSSGVVTVAGALDYESATSHNITVLATSDDTSTSSQVFSIAITDTNDNAPIITASQSFSVSELAANGFSLGNAVATDVDTGTTLSSWTITGGNGDSIFAIDGSTGEITVADNTNLDFDTTAGYTLSLTVTDGTNTSAVETIAITITDVSTAITAAQSFSILESATNGSAVGSVVTTGDSPKTFSITAGNTSSAFAIGNSGNITVADSSAIDYESLTSYTLTIQTSDGTTPVSETVTINITDVDEFDVSAVSDTNTATNAVDENVGTGTVVGLTAFASDADASLNTISYSLTDDAGGLFTIDGTSGVVTVNGALNYEVSTSHSITVRADSVDGSFNTQSFVIAINDLDEFDVSPISDTNASLNAVDENASVGTSVGITANASDADGSLNTISYSLSDDAGGLFSIDGSSGVVTVAGNLDYESATSHNITVVATSADSSTSSATFTVHVNPLNDNGAVISDQSVSLSEDANVGSALFDFDDGVSGSDLDADGDALSYSLIAGNDDGLFAIDPSTGVVTLVDTSSLDYESATSYILQVEASDGSFTSSAQLTIQISNVNEAPVISAPGSVSVDEDIALSIGNITVSDPDSGSLDIEVTVTSTHGVMTLGDQSSLSSIPVADGLNSFVLTGSASAINQALAGLEFNPDANFNGTASVSVVANDLGNLGSGSALSDSEVITITVIPVNDEPALDVPDLVEILPGESIDFSTALENLAPLQDLDSLNTTHNLSLSINNATLSISDSSLLSSISLNDGFNLEASGDIVTINEILNALVITPEVGFSGDLILDLYLEDEGSVEVGSARTLRTQVHLYVPEPAIPQDDRASEESTLEEQNNEPDLSINIDFEDSYTRIQKDDQALSQQDSGIYLPKLVFDMRIGAQGEVVADHSSALEKTDHENRNAVHLHSKLFKTIEFNPFQWLTFSQDIELVDSLQFTPSLQTFISDLHNESVNNEVSLGVRLAEISGVGFVVGSVVWILKGSSLLSSLLVSYPAWRGMDPLPVLLPKDNEDTDPDSKSSDDQPRESHKNPRFSLTEMGAD